MQEELNIDEQDEQDKCLQFHPAYPVHRCSFFPPPTLTQKRDNATGAVRIFKIAADHPISKPIRRGLNPLIYAIPLLIAFACFLPTLGFGTLNWDDNDMVVSNASLHASTLASLARFWQGSYLNLYTPLAYSLWWFVAKCSQSPAAFHACNLLLHLTNVALVMALLRRLGATPLAAAAAGLAFAVHPIQVEAVAWISGMNNLLAGTFALLALLGHAQEKPRWQLAALFAFTLALLSKPTVVALPLAAIAIDILQHRPWRQSAVRIVPWICLAIAFAIIARAVQPATLLPHPPMLDRFRAAAEVIAFYFKSISAPFWLTVDYGAAPTQIDGLIALLIAIAFAAAASLIFFLPANMRSTAAALALIFLAGVAPTLGFVPFLFQRFSTAADRYVYFSMLALAMLIARFNRPGAIAALVWIALLIPLTVMQIFTWRNDQTLFQRDLQINPTSLAAAQVLGTDAAARGQYDLAMTLEQSGLEHHPDDPRLNFAMGNLLLKANAAGAIPYYRKAIAGWADQPKMHNNLGIALARTGRREEAAAEFQIASQLNPGWLDPIHNLQALNARRH